MDGCDSPMDFKGCIYADINKHAQICITEALETIISVAFIAHQVEHRVVCAESVMPEIMVHLRPMWLPECEKVIWLFI